MPGGGSGGHLRPPILFVEIGVDLKASGRYVVGLRTSLDPDGYLDVCAAPRSKTAQT